MTSLLDRISLLASDANVTIGALEKEIGASKGVLSRAIQNSTDIQAKWVCKIVDNYPHYSSRWLLTGKGGMKFHRVTEIADRLSYLLSEYLFNGFIDYGLESIGETLGITAIELGRFTNLLELPDDPLDFAALVRKYPEINYKWLLFGVGVPILGDSKQVKQAISARNFAEYESRVKSEQDCNVSSDESILEQTERHSIPLYDASNSADIIAIFSNRYVKPSGHLRIPNLPHADGALYVKGESMVPLIKSGDIVIYKKLNCSLDSILWGQIYLLSFSAGGESFTVAKYLQKSDQPGYIRLVSQNERFQPKDIPLDSIHALAIVKASITFHTIE